MSLPGGHDCCHVAQVLGRLWVECVDLGGISLYMIEQWWVMHDSCGVDVVVGDEMSLV